MLEVYPNIYMITEKGSMGVMMPPVNIYVIAGHDGLIFDTGYGRKNAVYFLNKKLNLLNKKYTEKGKSFNIAKALPSHSHPDHFSGLRYLSEKLGVKSVVTEQMAKRILSEKHFYKGYIDKNNAMGPHPQIFEYLIIRYIQPKLLGTRFIDAPDEIIKDNSHIMINDETWQVLPAPGHCDDHIFLYHSEKGVLFSGDNIMRTITTWLGPPRSNLKDYLDTLESVLKLPKLELILSAHGSPIDKPKERVEELLSHRKARTNEVIEVIRKSGTIGIRQGRIIQKIYRGTEFRKRYISGGWILLTLKDLEEKGIVRKINDLNGGHYVIA